jgi:putative sterol carrier protein
MSKGLFMNENNFEFQYLSQPWLDEVIKRIKKNLTPEDMKKVSSSMKNIYHNCPDGKLHLLYFKFVNGILDEALVGTDDDEVANRESEFQIIGDYETFALISQAKLGARNALMRNRIKLKGSMVKALRLSSVVDRLNKIIAIVPAEF